MEPIWQTHSSPATHAVQDGPGQACLSQRRESQRKRRERCVCHIQQQLCSRVTNRFVGHILVNTSPLVSSNQRRVPRWRSLGATHQASFFSPVPTTRGDLKAKPVSRKPQHRLAGPPSSDPVSWVTLQQAAQLLQRWVTCSEGIWSPVRIKHFQRIDCSEGWSHHPFCLQCGRQHVGFDLTFHTTTACDFRVLVGQDDANTVYTLCC